MKGGWLKRTVLIGLALLIGALIVASGNAATSLVVGEPIIGAGHFGSIDAPDVAVLDLIFTGLPMFVLAALGDRRVTMWITAIILTCGFWGYFVWQIWRDSLTGFAGGANIGLGLVMMASPILVLLGMKAVSMIQRRLFQ